MPEPDPNLQKALRDYISGLLTKRNKRRKNNCAFDPDIENDETTWHRRLRHRSNILTILSTPTAFRGRLPDPNKVKATQQEDPCTICIGTKLQQRTYHGSLEKQIALPGARLHVDTHEHYDQGMGNRGEVFMTWEGFEPGTWSLELWDLKRFELRTL